MNRRNALGLLAMLPTAGAISVTETDQQIMFAAVGITPELVGKVVVFFNGEKLSHCILADATHGYCVVFVTNSDGSLKIVHSDYGRREVARKMIYGHVRIERIDDVVDNRSII